MEPAAGICASPGTCSSLLRKRLANEVKFHMEPAWDRGTKVCSNGPGHMPKMASKPIYGKNLKKSSSPEPKGR